jgi:plasmid replication initiation protein
MKISGSLDDNKKIVVTSNDLIHAKYTFTLWQKRVFVYMVSQINSFEDKEFQIHKMYIKDLMQFFKVKNKDDYNVISRIPEQLYEMSMKMPYRSEKGNKRWREVRILSQFTRPEDKEEDNAYIEMKFNDDLKPHLLELKKLFGQYDIRNIIHLRSVYSFKMYELIKSNEYLGKWEVTLEDLKEMLDVEDKYKHYGSFKLKILNQAQKDLTECCDVSFTYDEKAIRKRVEKLIFYIKKNSPTRDGKVKVEKPEEAIIVNRVGEEQNADDFDRLFSLYYLKVKEFGISASTLTTWIGKYPAFHIESCITDFLEKAQTGKLRNTEKAQQGGYLRTLIEKADFTAKQTTEKKKAETRQKQTVTETAARQKEDLKKQKIQAQIEREERVIQQLFSEYPTLEDDILTDINRREGTNYARADYGRLPFLWSKVSFIVKQRFADRF